LVPHISALLPRCGFRPGLYVIGLLWFLCTVLTIVYNLKASTDLPRMPIILTSVELVLLAATAAVRTLSGWQRSPFLSFGEYLVVAGWFCLAVVIGLR